MLSGQGCIYYFLGCEVHGIDLNPSPIYTPRKAAFGRRIQLHRIGPGKAAAAADKEAKKEKELGKEYLKMLLGERNITYLAVD